MGRRVLVTGASSGIGAAVATRLTDAGDTVAICARRADRLAEVPAQFRYTVDVGDLASLPELAAQVQHDLGGVDLLINNAGAARRRPMQRITLDEFHETMNVNFWSAVHLTHALLPAMLERDSGTIVNVSSMGTRTLAGRTGAYTAAKGALNHYTEALHLDPRARAEGRKRQHRAAGGRPVLSHGWPQAAGRQPRPGGDQGVGGAR